MEGASITNSWWWQGVDVDNGPTFRMNVFGFGDTAPCEQGVDMLFGGPIELGAQPVVELLEARPSAARDMTRAQAACYERFLTRLLGTPGLVPRVAELARPELRAMLRRRGA